MNIIKNILAMLSFFFFHTTTMTLQHNIKPIKSWQQTTHKGSLTVICGSMCCGKSEEMIRQINRFVLAGFNVLVFKPMIDDRRLLDINLSPTEYIASRSGSWVNCIAIDNIQTMEAIIDEYNPSIIAIDEVMLFITEKEKLLKLIVKLIQAKKKIIVSGLDLDFKAEPFGPIPDLLACADEVIKLKAICASCGDYTYCLTQRLIDGNPAHYSDPLIVVGDSQYEPRCRNCHIIRND